jgi:hypothetical protein
MGMVISLIQGHALAGARAIGCSVVLAWLFRQNHAKGVTSKSKMSPGTLLNDQ